MDLGVDRYLINYALRAIVAQRLLRRVCDSCKETYNPTSEEIEFYTKEKGTPPGLLVHGRMCETCHMTRYRGRAGIYELLEMDDDIRGLISAGTGETQFQEELAHKGFKSMNQEGLALVDSGVTSVREFIRTVYDAR
jgi:type II secretory ATPase GspE/PulE/Tfp pilus assembly ATPase PilB-like protein